MLAEAGRSIESLPKDLAGAIAAGRVPAVIVERFLELEKSAALRWLMQFGGFKERVLADDLFLAKVAMECGVGIFTKVFIPSSSSSSFQISFTHLFAFSLITIKLSNFQNYNYLIYLCLIFHFPIQFNLSN